MEIKWLLLFPAFQIDIGEQTINIVFVESKINLRKHKFVHEAVAVSISDI